ncbi:MAG: undecaprenyl-diphosphate phosphatase [Clostridia bacterium]|nr:undecaprenyl-diphosphate phosphatase [Clostridia bacterium]
MKIWQAIVLGAVQGFTEFLPVSSSGHLILTERWLGVNAAGGLFFDVMLHIGTLVPVVITFGKAIKGLFCNPKKILYLIIATVPAAVMGILFQDEIEKAFTGGDLMAVILLSAAFVLTAVELLFAEKLSRNLKNALPLSFKSSIIMGVFQGAAVIPGLSRSGTILTGGALSGLDGENNAEFTFLMSIPVILGAAAVSGAKAIRVGAEIDIIPVAFGVITAAITGYIAINAMLKAVKKARYKAFSVYLIFLATVSLATKLIWGV